MTEGMNTTPISDAECLRFEERLMAYLERELSDADRQWMDTHRASCARCEALVSDIDALVAQAAALPDLVPSRDLWSGIAERLDAPVVPLYSKSPAVSQPPVSARPAGRGTNVRWLAIAAAVLVTVTSAVTWRIARTPVDATPAVAVNDRAIDSTLDPVGIVPVVNASDVYEQEIAALRTIVNERFDELDTATVTVLKRNLSIIDKAIEDSRAALAKDPNSRALSTSLDKALESKLALMRRLALL
jgi:hypothetical protein